MRSQNRLIFSNYIFVVVSCISLCGYAATPQSLGDSLNAFAARYQLLDPIRVQHIRQKGRQITVHTNPSLSMLVLSKEEIGLLKQKVSMWVRGDAEGQVLLYSDGHEIEELIPSRLQPRPSSAHFFPKEHHEPLTRPLSRPYDVRNGLEDKHIALWASHGLYFQQDKQQWHWQRARLWTTVEDLYTSSYTMPFLVPMLENAGAVVIQPRERDTQTEEIITEAEDYRFIPALRKAGQYAVYVRYTASKHHTDKAVYTVVHSGRETSVAVNQQIGGTMWVYIGSYRFGTDSEANYIRLSNAGDGSLSVGQVRLGGGMGSIARSVWAEDSVQRTKNAQYAMSSNYPRWMEGARYWLEYNGFPDSIYSYSEGKNDYLDDLACRGRWVNYLAGGSTSLPHQSGLNIPVSLAVAIHSDAGVTPDTSKIGTLVIYSEKDDDRYTTYPAGGKRMIARDLADYIQTKIVTDVRHTMSGDWQRRGLKQASYSEARLPKVPCALVEMLSHQNYADMQLGLNPRFKFIVSRAIYKGILQFLHEQEGTPYVVQPLPIHTFGLTMADGDSIRLHWKARADSLEETAAPTYFVLYTREEGKDWDNGTRFDVHVSDYERIITHTVALRPGIRHDYRICAGNAGGISFPSETLSACIQPNKKTALIINGFTQVSAPQMMAADSMLGGIVPGSYAVPYGTEVAYIGEQCDFDRKHEWVNDDECGFGMCYSDAANTLTIGNTFDYPCFYGQPLPSLGYSYISQSMEYVTLSQSADYDALIICMGKQISDTIYWHPKVQDLIHRHLQRGGKLLLTGSYIGSRMKDKQSIQFASSYLHYRPYSSRATHSGIIRSTLPYNQSYLSVNPIEYSLSMHVNDSLINCEAPDAIEPTSSSQIILRYTDSGLCAGIGYQKQVVVLPFMLESVGQRSALYQRLLQYLFDE